MRGHNHLTILSARSLDNQFLVPIDGPVTIKDRSWTSLPAVGHQFLAVRSSCNSTVGTVKAAKVAPDRQPRQRVAIKGPA